MIGPRARRRVVVADALRMALPMFAAIALAASANAQQQQQKGYYPKPAPAPATNPQPANLPPANTLERAGTPGTCEHYCDRVDRCNIERYRACFDRCSQQGRDRDAAGRDQLASYTRATCEQLIVLTHQPHMP